MTGFVYMTGVFSTNSAQRGLKGAAGLALCLAFLVVFAGQAIAHVKVSPVTVAAGSTVDLALTVPSESATHATTEVELVFPTNHMPKSADAPVHSGWSSSIDSTSGKVASVSWSGGEIAPGKSDVFIVTVALPSDTPTLKLSIVQKYANGETVHWIDDSTSEGHEPEHPAPVLELTGFAPATTTSPTVSSVTVAPSAQTTAPSTKKISFGVYLIGIGAAVGMVVYVRLRSKSRRK